MYVDKGSYVELQELQDIRVIYTNKTYGNVMEFSKEKFLEDFSFEGRKLVAGHQTHSDNVAVITKDTDTYYYEDTDGFITNRKDIVIFTKYADCLPIFLYDEKNHAIGAVHSGWQGSFKEIAKNAINLMQQEFNSNLKDIVIVFGVGISKERYEVQEDFVEKFAKKFPESIVSRSFTKIGGKIYFDNQYFNYLNLLDYGIEKNNIITNELCTFEGNFHSYRRDRELSGRNGGFISFK